LTTAYRFLVVLIGLRMLAPPGICLCHAGAPAVRFVVTILDSSKQIPPEDENGTDDHEPGCPTSPLASGLGLQPPPVQVPPLLGCDLLGPVVFGSLPAAPLFAIAPLACPPPGPSLYLADCILLI